MFTANVIGLTVVAIFLSGATARSVGTEPKVAVRRAEQTLNTLVVTPNYVPLRRASVKPHQGNLHGNRDARADPHKPTLLRNIRDIYYIIDIEVGNQTIPVSVDTGSSDTWFIQQPFQCVDFFYETVPVIMSLKSP